VIKARYCYRPITVGALEDEVVNYV